MPIWTIWGSASYAYVARECLSGQYEAQLVMLMLQENAYLDNLGSASYANVARECLSGQSVAQLVMLMLQENAYLNNLWLS